MAFTNFHLFFDDVAIDQEWQSPGRTITQADIVNFAGISGDFNPIHIDHEFAKTTPFRQPIAHGLLILAVGSGLGINYPLMRTIAFLQIREWHFREPIFIGDTIHLRTRVLEKTLRGRGRRGEIIWARSIINQHGKLVQEGTVATLVEARGIKQKGEIATPTPVPNIELGNDPSTS